jgi:hypothetical protein
MRRQFQKTIYIAVCMLLLSQAAAVWHLYQHEHLAHTTDCVQCVQAKQYQTAVGTGGFVFVCPQFARDRVQLARVPAASPFSLFADARAPPVLLS